MRILFLILFSYIISVCCNRAFAQSEHAHDMLPICGAIEKIYDKTDFPKTGFLYIFHLKPNSCPRCEGGIFTATEMLKNRGIKPYIILDVADTVIAGQFINTIPQIDYFEKIVIDTNGYFRQTIDYEKTGLNIPYLYKISAKDKKFRLIQPLMTTISENVINEWISQDNNIPCKEPKSVSITNKTESKVKKSEFNWDKVALLKVKGESITSPNNVKITDNKIAFGDSYSNKVYVFNKNDYNCTVLSPTVKEYYIGSDLENDDSTKIKSFIKESIKSGLLRVIYLGVKSVTDSSVTIIASIPNISWGYDEEDKDTSFAYYNKAVLIEKSLDNNLKDVSKITIPSSSVFAYSHQRLQTFADTLMSLEISKGWPAVGTEFSEEEMKDIHINPFLDEFYDEIPQIAIVGNNGEHIGDFGSLNPINKKLNLGYAYGGVFGFMDKDKFLIVNQLWGDIQILSHQNMFMGINKMDTVFTLFKDKTNIKKNNINSYKSKMDYLQSYSEYILGKYIVCGDNLTDDYWYFAIHDKTGMQVTIELINKHTLKKTYLYSFPIQKKEFIKYMSINKVDKSNRFQLELITSIDNKNAYYYLKNIMVDAVE
jgi:hypothetical protein